MIIVLFMYLKGSVEHCMIGVQLLSQLTCEMNQISEADANRSLTKHRKIASSFRDTQLFEIFRLSCSLLVTARENCKSLNFNDEGQVCPYSLPYFNPTHLKVYFHQGLAQFYCPKHLKYITISTFFWVFVHFVEKWQKNFSRVILLWRWENMFLLNVVVNEGGWVRQSTTVVWSYLLVRRWRHVSAVLGHLQVIN